MPTMQTLSGQPKRAPVVWTGPRLRDVWQDPLLPRCEKCNELISACCLCNAPRGTLDCELLDLWDKGPQQMDFPRRPDWLVPSWASSRPSDLWGSDSDLAAADRQIQQEFSEKVKFHASLARDASERICS